jgi:long-subunit acyl-CoA synthetase (AMP-forming)
LGTQQCIRRWSPKPSRPFPASRDLPACRPTVFLADPRVWEKFREAIEDHVHHEPAAIRAAIHRFVALGPESVAAEQDGVPMLRSSAALHAALDRTIGRTMRSQVGLDQAHVLVTAAAPTHPDLIRWFHAIGLRVLELFGQTEDCGPTAATAPGMCASAPSARRCPV